MLDWQLHHPRMTIAHLGYIPAFVLKNDPRPAKEQFNERYVYGGWRPFGAGEWTLGEDNSLSYPGDPHMRPLASAKLRDETIVFYESAWVAIIQPDRSFEVCRMD